MNLERNGDMTATQIAQRLIDFDSDTSFIRAVAKVSDRRFDEIYSTYLKMANAERTKRKKKFFSEVKSKAITHEADYLRVVGFSKIIAIKAIDKGNFRDTNKRNEETSLQTLDEFTDSFRSEARNIFEKNGDTYSDDQFNRMFAETKKRAKNLYLRYSVLNSKSIKNHGKPLSYEEGKEIIFGHRRDEDEFALEEYVESAEYNKFIEKQTQYIELLMMWRDLPEDLK